MTVSVKCSVVIAVSALAATDASAEVINVSQAVSKAGVQTDVGETRIVVDGRGTERFDHVVTNTVSVWVKVSGEKPSNGNGASDGKLRVESTTIPIGTPAAPRIYKVSFPYRDPKSASVANVRVSPVDLCNARLAKLSGAARAKFLREGDLFDYPGAYAASGSIVWRIKDHEGRVQGPGRAEDIRRFGADPNDDRMPGARSAEGPVRKDQRATGGTTPRAKKMDPTIESATLRMEPASIQRVGGQMCPTELRLYGQVRVIRPFRGSAIILGPGYLSPITSLNFPAAGTRAVRATYPLKWSAGASGSLAVGGAGAPRSQTVSLRMNVANEANKVIETAAETIKVTCKAAQPQRVGSSEPQRVAPGPARVGASPAAVAAGRQAGNFDVRIRRADRDGPGGSVQLWVYNAGPETASGCSIAARSVPGGALQEVAAVAALGPRQTLKLPGSLPQDAAEFEVRCPGEPQAAKANNGWRFNNGYPVKWEGPAADRPPARFPYLPRSVGLDGTGAGAGDPWPPPSP